jgi:hypothetical protein
MKWRRPSGLPTTSCPGGSGSSGQPVTAARRPGLWTNIGGFHSLTSGTLRNIQAISRQLFAEQSAAPATRCISTGHATWPPPSTPSIAMRRWRGPRRVALCRYGADPAGRSYSAHASSRLSLTGSGRTRSACAWDGLHGDAAVDFARTVLGGRRAICQAVNVPILQRRRPDAV